MIISHRVLDMKVQEKQKYIPYGIPVTAAIREGIVSIYGLQ